MSVYKNVAIRAARQAGTALLQRFNKLYHGEVRRKAPHDIVTSADLEANRIIVREIRKNFPDHDILSEETGFNDQPSDFLWTIDPLDGTVNYTIGNPMYCTAISLRRGTETLLSVIYAPSLGEFYYAEKGRGAYLNGKRIHVAKTKKLSDAIVLLGRTHNARSRKIFISLQTKLQKSVLNLRWEGSGSLDLALVAVGRVGGCIFSPPDLSLWDTTPGVLMVREAGGLATNFDGLPRHFRKRGLLASNGLLQKQLLRNLRRWRY